MSRLPAVRGRTNPGVRHFVRVSKSGEARTEVEVGDTAGFKMQFELEDVPGGKVEVRAIQADMGRVACGYTWPGIFETNAYREDGLIRVGIDHSGNGPFWLEVDIEG